MDSNFNPRELDADLQATELAASARAAYFAKAPPMRRWRDVQVVAASQPAAECAPGVGRSLISRRPAPRQKRYERIIAEERLPADRLDYKLQICCASAVLEEEVNDLLTEPLKPHAARLAEAVRAHGGKDSDRTATLLDRWGAGTVPTTLGLVTMGLLVGVRRALSHDEAAFAPELEKVFTPELVAAFRANSLGPTLDRLRETRNAACHPIGNFDEASYREFISRLVGNTALAEWERDGPAPSPPPPEAAFLHRLLTGSRLVPQVDLPAQGSAIDRLTALAAPRPDAFALELVPYTPASGHRFRDVTVEAVRAEPGFRLGGEVVLRVRAGRDCHLTLIDLGTSGAVSLLLPNAHCPRPVLKKGESAYFPGPGFADFAFTLTGLPGRERLIAFATTNPLPGLPAPAPLAVFAGLSSADLDRITDAARRLPAGEWSAAACEFTIEG